MNFQAETHLARIRPSAGRLFFAFVALFLAAALVGFYAGRLPEQWQNILVWSVAALIAIVFWLIPLIRNLTHWTDVYSSKITSRSGLFGQHFREVSLRKITGVQVGPKRSVIVMVQGEDPMVLTKIGSPKNLAAEINALIASK
jgi:hypothetical protein